MRFIESLAGLCVALLAACGAPGPLQQEPTAAARTWDAYKLRAAQRIQAANPEATFSGPLPDPLQSIPVLQVHLNGDGSVREIVVLRVPGQSPQTVDMARRAIQRAAPFGPVGQLPLPWRFSETFLYNQELKFQLRTLVEAP